MAYLTFQPVYQQRVWGARNLETALGRTLPWTMDNQPVGESWEVVDRPGEAMSVVEADCPHPGKTLRELLENPQTCTWLMGPQWEAGKAFPVLVKWLDCAERLSLQVHPPANIAPKLGGQPKTECWYIAQATEDAALIAGLKKGVTKESFEAALKEDTLEALCHKVPSKVGDSLFVPSGRLHAIDGGNLILEVQQNSDTTYRVYDWGRMGTDGKPRQLHVEESLASINFDDFEPPLTEAAQGHQRLVNCPEFRLVKLELNPGDSVEFNAGEAPRLLSVVKGSVQAESAPKASEGTPADADTPTLPMGANALLPHGETNAFVAGEAGATLLVTDGFATPA